jgi:hypothetical protein
MSSRGNALAAARSLAKKLSLPSRGGTVLAWNDGSCQKIVVCADSAWLQSHSVPRQFEGFAVETSDQLIGEAHSVRRAAR